MQFNSTFLNSDEEARSDQEHRAGIAVYREETRDRYSYKQKIYSSNCNPGWLFGNILLTRIKTLREQVDNTGFSLQKTRTEASQFAEDVSLLFNIKGTSGGGACLDFFKRKDFSNLELALDYFQKMERIALLSIGLRVMLADSDHINFKKIKVFFELYGKATHEEKEYAHIYWVGNNKTSGYGENGFIFSSKYINYLFLAEITPDIFFLTLPVIGFELSRVFGSSSKECVLSRDFNRHLILATIKYKTERLTVKEKILVTIQPARPDSELFHTSN